MYLLMHDWLKVGVLNLRLLKNMCLIRPKFYSFTLGCTDQDDLLKLPGGPDFCYNFFPDDILYFYIVLPIGGFFKFMDYNLQ